MRQDMNLIEARVFSAENGSVWGNFCIYSRMNSIKYEIELIPLKIRSSSPKINIAYGANLDIQTG